MKIQVIGVGRLGSQVAFNCLAFLKPEELWLDDVKDLTGDVLDLKHSARGLNLDTKIEAGLTENPDYIIITAGMPRDPGNKDMNHLLDMNKKILNDILTKKINAETKSKIIIVTNPTDVLTKWAKENFNKYEFYNNDEILLRYRDGKDCGWDVVRSKGYSSLAPALSIVEVIKKLKEGKPL